MMSQSASNVTSNRSWRHGASLAGALFLLASLAFFFVHFEDNASISNSYALLPSTDRSLCAVLDYESQLYLTEPHIDLRKRGFTSDSLAAAAIMGYTSAIERRNKSTPLEPLFKLPLTTRGRDIVDADGARVKLASVNWYGASDVLFLPGGLDVRHRDDIARTIRDMGFNSVRLPYSDELVLCNPKIGSHLVPANPDLAGERALDIFTAVVESLTDAGIAVIVNNHITHSRWFDGYSLCDAGWSNDHLAPFCRIKQTEQSWIANWEMVMAPLVDNPLVIGADLRNEVHGFWGTMKWPTWAAAAERAGNALLSVQPKWLMFVEGVSSANDLSGVEKRPVKLDVENRLVYSSHVYSWSGWGDMSPFSRRSYEGFVEQMRVNWGFLLEKDIAPVWVGEFGAPYAKLAGAGDRHYWKNLMRYLDDVDADFGYWAINPRKPADHSNESYAIIQRDWKTEFPNDYRMRDMRELTKPKGNRTATWEMDDHTFIAATDSQELGQIPL